MSYNLIIDKQEIGEILENLKTLVIFTLLVRQLISRSKIAHKTTFNFIGLTYSIATWIALWNEACLLQAQSRLSISDAAWWNERLIACTLAVYATVFHHG